MKSLPSFFNYGKYSSSNYGYHTIGFSVNGVDYYFSYNTLVAFDSPKTGLVCQINYWGNTTGKHLNWIEPNHNKRVNQEEFYKLLSKV